MLAVALASSATAQMQLPGAVAPAEQGAKVSPANAPKPKPKGPPPPPKLPSDEALLGRALEQNGRAGAIQFTRDGKEIRVTRLLLPGEKISRPAESCAVEPPGSPFLPVPTGRPSGVARYGVALTDCPFEFDVLDGAILVVSRPKACEFAALDCRVDPAGLWGQPAAEIGEKRAKEIERARGPAEQTMRTSFRTWVESVSKDREMVRQLSRDQAGFSSRRAEICARYARESEHGYCSLTLTRARLSALAARVPPPAEPVQDTQADAGKRKKDRP